MRTRNRYFRQSLLGCLAMVIVFFLMAPFAYSVEKTQGKDVIYHEVRVIDSTITGISNPAGLSFSPKANNFQIMNANNPSGQTVSTFTDLMSVTMDEKNNGSIHIPAANLDPVNSTYDEQLGGLLILDRSGQNLVIVPEGSDSKLLPSKLAHHDIKSWKLDKPMGMTVDQARGQIFILDQSGPALVKIVPADSWGLEDASVTKVDLQQLGIVKPRGLAFDPATGHLHLFSKGNQTLYEITQSGQIVATRDFSSF